MCVAAAWQSRAMCAGLSRLHMRAVEKAGPGVLNCCRLIGLRCLRIRVNNPTTAAVQTSGGDC